LKIPKKEIPMRRRPLRLAAVLLLTLGLSIALTSGCATTSTSGADPEACPNISCHSEVGHNQCISAGCSCISNNDFCERGGPAAPRPTCPAVSCQTPAGFNQCVAAGCACNARTNGCAPGPKK
jgi:hypothetical protein